MERDMDCDSLLCGYAHQCVRLCPSPRGPCEHARHGGKCKLSITCRYAPWLEDFWNGFPLPPDRAAGPGLRSGIPDESSTWTLTRRRSSVDRRISIFGMIPMPVIDEVYGPRPQRQVRRAVSGRAGHSVWPTPATAGVSAYHRPKSLVRFASGGGLNARRYIS